MSNGWTTLVYQLGRKDYLFKDYLFKDYLIKDYIVQPVKKKRRKGSVKHDDINKNTYIHVHTRIYTYIHVYTRIYMYIREEKRLEKGLLLRFYKTNGGIRNVESQL